MHRTVHRILLMRVMTAAVILCLCFAILSASTSRRQIESEVAELAQIRFGQFNNSILDVLDRGEISPVTLRERLDRFVARSAPIVLRDGRFVFIRIYDQQGSAVLDVADPGYAQIGLVADAIEQAEVTNLAPGKSEVVTVTLDTCVLLTR